MIQKNRPRGEAATKPQGTSPTFNGNDNSTTFKEFKSRYDKGMELYRDGNVKLSSNLILHIS